MSTFLYFGVFFRCSSGMLFLIDMQFVHWQLTAELLNQQIFLRPETLWTLCENSRCSPDSRFYNKLDIIPYFDVLNVIFSEPSLETRFVWSLNFTIDKKLTDCCWLCVSVRQSDSREQSSESKNYASYFDDEAERTHLCRASFSRRQPSAVARGELSADRRTDVFTLWSMSIAARTQVRAPEWFSAPWHRARSWACRSCGRGKKDFREESWTHEIN